jgi:soluble lytic murein transglycosylase-like protein
MLGVKYLNYLSTQFNDLKLICLAYNAGDGNVKKGIFDFRYWLKIKRFYQEFENFLKQYKEKEIINI